MAIQVSSDGQAIIRCSYCRKPITKRQFINPWNDRRQCSRLLCRIWTGNLFWMKLGRQLRWYQLPIYIPYLTKKTK